MQRRVRVTQPDGKKFTYMPLGEAGDQPWAHNHQESWLLETGWVWLVEAPGAKRLTRGAVAANCSSARWRGFLEDAAVVSNPKPSIKRQTGNLRFNISDLKGQLWLLTALVGVVRKRERSDGLFPLHGYLHRTMPSARREDKE